MGRATDGTYRGLMGLMGWALVIVLVLVVVLEGLVGRGSRKTARFTRGVGASNLRD